MSIIPLIIIASNSAPATTLANFSSTQTSAQAPVKRQPVRTITRPRTGSPDVTLTIQVFKEGTGTRELKSGDFVVLTLVWTVQGDLLFGRDSEPVVMAGSTSTGVPIATPVYDFFSDTTWNELDKNARTYGYKKGDDTGLKYMSKTRDSDSYDILIQNGFRQVSFWQFYASFPRYDRELQFVCDGLLGMKEGEIRRVIAKGPADHFGSAVLTARLKRFVLNPDTEN